MKIRWIRRSRKEATEAYGMTTRTVYYRVLQYFDGEKWKDVETVDKSIDNLRGSDDGE